MNFQDFIPNKETDLAYCAAQKVAGQLGFYNPLFIYGETGSGKTHLLKAIEHDLKAQKKRILYIGGDLLIGQMQAAMKTAEIENFYRGLIPLDCLLIDDVHYSIGSSRVSEEFVYLIERMLHAGKQLVFAANTRPVNIPGISDRLLSRFSWGLVCETPSMDLQAARKFLAIQLVQQKLALPAEIREKLLLGGICRPYEIKGRVIGLKARLSAEPEIPDAARLSQLLTETISPGASFVARIKPYAVLEKLAQTFAFNIADIVGPRQTRNNVRHRHLAIYAIRKLTDCTLAEIGQLFGNRDHSTILHAVNKITARCQNEPEWGRELNTLLGNMKAELSA